MEALKKKLSAKLKQNGGFTLVEMLIVVAIIAILIIVSFPMVSGSLEKAREATDNANMRSAQSMAETYFLLNASDSTKMTFTDEAGTKICKLYYKIDSDTHQGEIVSGTQPTDGFDYGLSGTNKDHGVIVTINSDGEITDTSWSTT